MTTTISWPARLPLPTFDGYAVEPQDATTRTDMEAGPARQRRRFTSVPTRIPVRWRLSQTEFAIFEAWFRLKISGGAEWFAIDLLSGIGIAPHEARFLGQGGSPYRAVPSRGGTWIVTSVLEVRQRLTLDEGTLEILLEAEPMALLAAVPPDRWRPPSRRPRTPVAMPARPRRLPTKSACSRWPAPSPR